MRNYDLEAIVALSKQGALAKDLRFENNLFENVKRTAILISVIEDAEILNNKFYNFCLLYTSASNLAETFDFAGTGKGKAVNGDFLNARG